MRTLFLALLLTSQLAGTAFGKNLYIPVGGVTPGQNGSYWRTDVRIFNPSRVHEIDVTLHFLPQGQDGRNIPGRMFHLGKRETLVLDNVVATLVPEATQALGAIRIDSDNGMSHEFIASSRTYTNSAHQTRPGTFGQFVPALDPAGARPTTVALHVSSAEFRTNFGVMNPGSTAVTVQVTLLGTDGQPFLVSSPQVVPPKSMQQWSMSELFGGVYMENGTAVFEASAPVFSWISRIDNASGDAIFVQGMEDGTIDGQVEARGGFQ